MQIIGQSQPAFERLQHALSLDPKYGYTQGLLGEYYLRLASSTEDRIAKKEALQTAAEYYQTAAAVSKKTDQISKASYLVSLGNVYTIMASLDPQKADLAKLQQAVDALLESVDAGLSANDLWKVQEAIAKLYIQLGEKSLAQYYASQALSGAPSSATSRLQNLITETMTMP
jgi:hypothetical protein